MAYIWHDRRASRRYSGDSQEPSHGESPKGELEEPLELAAAASVFICAPDFAGVETIEGEFDRHDAPRIRRV